MQQKKTVGLATGAAGPGRGKAGSPAGPAFNDRPTLADVRIKKSQYSVEEAEYLRALPSCKQDNETARHRDLRGQCSGQFVVATNSGRFDNPMLLRLMLRIFAEPSLLLQSHAPHLPSGGPWALSLWHYEEGQEDDHHIQGILLRPPCPSGYLHTKEGRDNWKSDSPRWKDSGYPYRLRGATVFSFPPLLPSPPSVRIMLPGPLRTPTPKMREGEGVICGE